MIKLFYVKLSRFGSPRGLKMYMDDSSIFNFAHKIFQNLTIEYQSHLFLLFKACLCLSSHSTFIASLLGENPLALLWDYANEDKSSQKYTSNGRFSWRIWCVWVLVRACALWMKREERVVNINGSLRESRRRSPGCHYVRLPAWREPERFSYYDGFASGQNAARASTIFHVVSRVYRDQSSLIVCTGRVVSASRCRQSSR